MSHALYLTCLMHCILYVSCTVSYMSHALYPTSLMHYIYLTFQPKALASFNTVHTHAHSTYLELIWTNRDLTHVCTSTHACMHTHICLGGGNERRPSALTCAYSPHTHAHKNIYVWVVGIHAQTWLMYLQAYAYACIHNYVLIVRIKADLFVHVRMHAYTPMFGWLE